MSLAEANDYESTLREEHMKASFRSALIREAKGVVWTLPALTFLGLFTLYPMVNAIITSFYNWNMTGRKKYIGIYNYQKLFRTTEIWETIGRTLQYVVYILPAALIVGFLLALLLKRPSKLNVFYRTLIFTPRVASMVALSMVWMFIYNPQYGLLNRLLGVIGISPVRWINDPSTALISICIITIWRMVGYNAVVFLGGIQNISEELLEAAEIDGARGVQATWYITIPLVSPTAFMLMILNSIEILRMFTTINVLTEGGPAGATTNLVVMLYEYAFKRYQVGYASAIALVLFLLILTINFMQMGLERFVNYDL